MSSVQTTVTVLLCRLKSPIPRSDYVLDLYPEMTRRSSQKRLDSVALFFRKQQAETAGPHSPPSDESPTEVDVREAEGSYSRERMRCVIAARNKDDAGDSDPID
jgi:hypothetical protein